MEHLVQNTATPWEAFIAVPHRPQTAVGYAPAKWVLSCGLAGVTEAMNLPNQQISRQQVREICQDPATDVLTGFICAMAWGDQNKPNAMCAWGARDRLRPALLALRRTNLTRSEAFDLFCGSKRIPGLGPAFFTKLLYFFGPQPKNYIMDQWTARSVNLITGRQVVLMDGVYVHQYATGGHYQAFCDEVDRMADWLGCSGQDVEERLFSQGGRKKWPWREYVKNNG